MPLFDQYRNASCVRQKKKTAHNDMIETKSIDWNKKKIINLYDSKLWNHIEKKKKRYTCNSNRFLFTAADANLLKKNPKQMTCELNLCIDWEYNERFELSVCYLCMMACHFNIRLLRMPPIPAERDIRQLIFSLNRVCLKIYAYFDINFSCLNWKETTK